ncbi:hypothetical protein M6D93_00195 [Jatrophihabitans telluris]|uniref:Uncharacterized protein n=1 Tax=Jatrophihabitans telluris TaxID=2038343 RepID=A0ABY4QZV1_9ACTN|nr:hypothetical protein [Jatrophihabitans telluris]UQX88440.1 hypothetical protein M6D93_00195 [Jatrophihabitans telluris]
MPVGEGTESGEVSGGGTLDELVLVVRARPRGKDPPVDDRRVDDRLAAANGWTVRMWFWVMRTPAAGQDCHGRVRVAGVS